jgi:hypothetical protein
MIEKGVTKVNRRQINNRHRLVVQKLTSKQNKANKTKQTKTKTHKLTK